MSVPISQPENAEALRAAVPEPPRVREKLRWETPRMEEVSEQVMAQPYIRFT